jgi:hypothetical protein
MSGPAGEGGTTGRPRNQALADRWRQLPGAAAAPLPGAPGAAPASPVESPEDATHTAHIAKTLAPYFADGVIAAERWIIAWDWPTRGREANDPDEAARKDLHKCAEVLLRRYVPNLTIGPWGEAALAVSLLYGSMRIGAPLKPPAELPPAKPADPAPSLRSVPASTVPPVTTPIPPSSPPPKNSENSDAGTVPHVGGQPWD